MAVDEVHHLHAVVVVQHHLGIAEVLPVQLHADRERGAEQMRAELGRHALALFQKAGQLIRCQAPGLRGRGNDNGTDGDGQPGQGPACARAPGKHGAFSGLPAASVDAAGNACRAHGSAISLSKIMWNWPP